MSAEPPATPQRATRSDVIATLVIIVATLALVAARPVTRKLARHPTREQCAAMLDLYAEQQARAANLTPPTDASERAGAAPPEIDRCMRDLTAEEVECALRATYVDAIERCLP